MNGVRVQALALFRIKNQIPLCLLIRSFQPDVMVAPTILEPTAMSSSARCMIKINITNFTPAELSRIIEMAWEDRTPFEAIKRIFGLNESAVVQLMRRELKSSSFRLWRERMAGRVTKHQQLRSPDISRAYCPSQYKR